jgi:NAD(P)H-nitrite reductase large subunit
MSLQRFVIVGAGPAGLQAAESIRALDGRAEILVVSDEPSYARMALPYWLTAEIEREHLITGRKDSFERIGVQLREGVLAEGIEPRRHVLHLSDGKDLVYDRLLLATGSTPQIPRIPGVDLPGVHTFWTLADAERILRGRGDDPEVLLLGAGFVGLIVAAAMVKLGWRLRIVEMLPRILPRMLDDQAAGMVASWLQGMGVDLQTGVQTASISEASSSRKLVKFENGTSAEADLVVLATGVRPRVDLARAAGLAVDQGILVDEHLRSSDPDIFAAGDAAQGPVLKGDFRQVHAIQPTATDHGRIAGANMAGKSVVYDGSLAMNLLDVGGIHCVSLGAWEGDGLEAHASLEPFRPMYRKLVWEGDVLAGAILVGPRRELARQNDVGMIKGMIQSGVRMGGWKRYLEVNPWDIRRAYTAARVAELLLGRSLISIPPRPRTHRHLDRGPDLAPKATSLQLLRHRPEHLDVPINTPPFR